MAVKEILQKKLVIHPDTQQLYRRDWDQFKQKMEKVSSSAKITVRRLREIADRNHEAWWDHKVKSAFASSLFLVAALIALWTERKVAICLGIFGAVIAAQASFAQNGQDLKDYKMAKEFLEETEDNFIALNKMIHDWSDEKEYERMVYIYQLAEYYGVATPQVSMILLKSIFETVGTPWNLHSAGTIEESQKNFNIVFNTGFLVLNAMELGFNIRDLVRNKGSDLAKELREIAKEIEDGFIQ